MNRNEYINRYKVGIEMNAKCVFSSF